ncbi:MAG: S-methyl-5-thioribose-1-phosphate isomerase [Acidobacteria bacterium]|nr:S-methyl-5-thioribose-1-phosphate isomerase [Acidobacteriota bacterium]
MRIFESLALRYDGRRLLVLDQTALPFREDWLEGNDPAAMVGHIQRLSVRGAPLIGVAAACSLACHAMAGSGQAELAAAWSALRAARPTAVNLMWAMDRLRPLLPRPEALIAEAQSILDEDVRLCEGMAEHGAALVQDGEGLITHCNTGGLATVGIGTALGVIRRAHEQGKRIHVYVDETRPLLQGGRLTTWELQRLGIPCTLITDSMAALILRDGRAQRALVGSDRVAANGDFANKVGTYGLAVQARHHGAAFHPVAPFSTVDLACPDGAAIPIEERAPEEVRGAQGRPWAPEVPVWNPSFDVTPVAYVTSLVLDRAVLTCQQLQAGNLATLLG